jgi:hypothetical protein
VPAVLDRGEWIEFSTRDSFMMTADGPFTPRRTDEPAVREQSHGRHIYYQKAGALFSCCGGHMSSPGILVSICELKTFDFSFLAAGAGSNQTEVLARAINVIPYSRLSLLTRVHVNGLGSGTSFDILVASTYPSDVDQVSFVQTAAITRNLVSTDAAGVFYTDMANSMGPYVQVSIRGNQHTSSATRVQGKLSIALLLRQDPV